jgi:pilus assembly protein CpaB
MNRSRLLFIAIVAILLGLMAAYQVRRMLASSFNPQPLGVDVVVAAENLNVGTRIGENSVKIVKFPSSELPANHFRQKSQVVGHGVILPIAKGEFLLPGKIAGENAGSGLPSLIPPGMRAVSVRVNEVVSVAGFVLPGTRVDVMLTGNPAGGGEQQTTTVLENVAVLATGQRLEHNNAGESQMAPVITLLVTPDDAQRLALASTQGHIQLALRNPLDTQQHDLPAAKSDALYKIAAAPAAAPKPKVKRVTAPAPPAAFSVEVIRGDHKDVTKFEE